MVVPDRPSDQVGAEGGVSSVPASMSVDRQGPNVCIVSPGAAVVLVAVVDEEAGQPGLEPIRIAEAGQLTPGDHQRVLDRVLGSFVVSQDPSRDPEQPVTAGASQDGECLPVTAWAATTSSGSTTRAKGRSVGSGIHQCRL